MSNDKRNETQPLLAILDAESLVDEITHNLATSAANAPTATAILGSFWRKDSPCRAMGDTIVSGFEASGNHALVSIAPNGLYEQLDPGQPDMNMRGRFITGADGAYRFYCLRRTKYPIPFDQPAGKVLLLLDRHPWRPAHIHFIVTAAGYKPLVTQISDWASEFVCDGEDVAFAVKEILVVDFVPVKVEGEDGEWAARFESEYDFKLARFGEGREAGDAATLVAP